jgi:hypothetical protein
MQRSLRSLAAEAAPSFARASELDAIRADASDLVGQARQTWPEL